MSYCKYGISYRDLEETMREEALLLTIRRFTDGHTIDAPALKKRLLDIQHLFMKYH